MSSYMTVPSVCLPRIWIHFDQEYVENVFCDLLGQDADGNSCVAKIDLRERSDRNTGDAYWLCFVHFSDKMIETDTLTTFCTRADKGFNLVYDPDRYGKAFWKVRKNTHANSSTARSGPKMMSERDEADLLKAQKAIKEEQAKCVTPKPDPVAAAEEPPTTKVTSSVTTDGESMAIGKWGDEE